MPPVECVVEKIVINLKPSLDRFEEEMCQKLNEDRMRQHNTIGDGAGVEIVRRSLRVSALWVGICITVVL